MDQLLTGIVVLSVLAVLWGLIVWLFFHTPDDVAPKPHAQRVERLLDKIEQLPESEQQEIDALMDAYLKASPAKRAAMDRMMDDELREQGKGK